ncbi:type I restriction-modification system subunit M N-terminal domain-containing protein [Stenotrophomonas pavanii]|uniref:type I restriction-modification system subunit M N-terminal domain-containing protein n=1 Tax=Stenotrophomonas pavanii TaxID=487698 RepID=UPI0020CE18C2|nr:type I restriction-modification system subunit M N-terminal domain-containing protein [Stenotrophomonas pavanii]
MSVKFQQLANFIWSVADLLRGPYRPPQYERVMLPLTVLRRFDAVLAPSKEAVLKRYETLRAKNIPNIDAILNGLAKDEHGTALGFHNHSQLDFQKLKGDPDNIGRHLADYIAGFSENIRKIFERFEFDKEIEKLEESNRLYQVVSQFAEIDLHPRRVDNITMGLVFEDLIRRFNEAANETAGDHFTPREVIRSWSTCCWNPTPACSPRPASSSPSATRPAVPAACWPRRRTGFAPTTSRPRSRSSDRTTTHALMP